MDIKEKVLSEIENKEWVLLNQYHNKYPANWIKTINKCLENDENKWEFRYNSKGELERIRIITIEPSGFEWNYYIQFGGRYLK